MAEGRRRVGGRGVGADQLVVHHEGGHVGRRGVVQGRRFHRARVCFNPCEGRGIDPERWMVDTGLGVDLIGTVDTSSDEPVRLRAANGNA